MDGRLTVLISPPMRSFVTTFVTTFLRIIVGILIFNLFIKRTNAQILHHYRRHCMMMMMIILYTSIVLNDWNYYE
jgi:uncharacterized membrane protein YgaE (UPF0421/DUF939 family)